MRVAWCPQHRGVMRIAFFDPPQPHFYNPCPRCGKDLKNEIRNKYELNTPGAKEQEPEFLEHKVMVKTETGWLQTTEGEWFGRILSEEVIL